MALMTTMMEQQPQEQDPKLNSVWKTGVNECETRHLQLHLLLTQQLCCCVKKGEDGQPGGRIQLACILVSTMTAALDLPAMGGGLSDQ
jgi:hypothetical protein